MNVEDESTEVDDKRVWRSRPGLARAARITILGVPFVLVTGTAWKLNALLGEPANVVEAIARWAALSVVSTLALISIDRTARQYLPLSALLQLAVVFPDQAPSRMKLALRRGTASHLAKEVAALEDASAQQAAEYLLQIVGKLTAHDRLTRGHTERVRAYSDLVAVEMGFTKTERMKLQWAGLLHDVGKLTVPAEVLNKSSALNEREWSRLKTHPAEGWKMVQPMRGWLGEWARATRDHHERWDGGGYPRGLRGTEISRAGRIISVVDAFDVMTTVRAYKTAMPHDKARAELARCAGAQFDPEVVRAFLRVSLAPRQRGRIGTWLANSPVALQATSLSNLPAVATSAIFAVFAASTVVLPMIGSEPHEEAAERIVAVDKVTPPVSTTAITTTAAPSTTTTTTPPPASSSPPTLAETTLPPIAQPPTTPAPTTSLPVSTTTSPTTTTTGAVVFEAPTTTTTTTTPPPNLDGRYLGAGSGKSFSLVSGVEGGGATNWDAERNADPGLTLTSGPTGLAELDADNVVVWTLKADTDTAVSGFASLRVYVAAPNFSPDTTAAISAGLADCANKTANCTTLGTGQAVFNQADLGDGFGAINIIFGSIDHVVPAGHTLVVSMTVPQVSPSDAWLAFGTADYPSHFRID